MALLAASIPCAVIVVIVTALFREWQDSHLVQAAIHGAIAAAVAITAKTSWTVARPIYVSGERNARLRVVLLGGASFALHVSLGVPAIDVLLLGGLAGAFMAAVQP